MNQTEGPIAYTSIPDKVTRNAQVAFAGAYWGFVLVS